MQTTKKGEGSSQSRISSKQRYFNTISIGPTCQVGGYPEDLPAKAYAAGVYASGLPKEYGFLAVLEISCCHKRAL